MKRIKNRRELQRIYAGQAMFWCRDARDLPAPEQLQRAVAAQLSGVLLFSRWPSETEKARCLAQVQAALPGAQVRDAGVYHGFDRVLFQRVLGRAEVMAHADELLESAREFTRLANDLSHQLAAKIGISATQLSLNGRFLPPDQLEEWGELNAEWNFHFHGFECAFTHRQSKQMLDVIFGFCDEFGALQPYFWLQFLQTTPRHADLANWLALGHADATRTVDVLCQNGFLIEIQSSPDFVVKGAQRSGWIVAPAE